MDLTAILWLALLVVLAVLFALTLRRLATLVARTRSLERLQRTVVVTEQRFEAVVGPLVGGLDEARRQAAQPDRLSTQLAEVQAVLDELRAEAGQLEPPAPALAAVQGIVEDLDRAIRAASLVEHGLAAMEGKSLGRDLEAQISLKRGTLSLRHTREALALHAREIARLQPSDLAGPSVRRLVSRITMPAPAATASREPIVMAPAEDPSGPATGEAEASADPRM